MQNTLRVAYPQPFANPGMNSVAAVGLAPSLSAKPKVSAPIPLISAARPDSVRWLLSGVAPNKLLAVGKTHYWLVDLEQRAVIAADFTNQHTLVAFLPDGRYVYRMDSVLMLRDPVPLAAGDRAGRGQQIRVNGLGPGSVIHAFAPLGTEFVAVVQNYALPIDASFREARVVRKPLSGTLRDEKWSLRYNVEGHSSPVLTDGTVILHLPDGLHVIGPDGKDLRVIKTELLPDLISVDHRDRIWGFLKGEEQTVLVGLSATGETQVKVDLHVTGPLQPPVTLGDGRIIIASPVGVLCVEGDKVAWVRAFPGSQNLLVTGTGDNRVLVRTNDTVALLGQDQHRLWSVRSPDKKAITSNVVVTAGGGVCYASGLNVHCLEP